MLEPNDLTAFTDEDVESLLNDDIEQIQGRIHRQEQPMAILLAGQPGAGKTEISTMMAKQLNKDAVFLNGDDYRRYHPHYKELYAAYGADAVPMTSAFSSAVVNKMIECLSDERMNLIVEGTGRTVEVPKTTAEKLKAKGYTVELAVIATRPELSLISTLLRFYQMSEGGTIPRATAVEAHDRVVEVLPGNLDILKDCPGIDRISIWDRNLTQLYGPGKTIFPPSVVLRQYWNRPWTAEELDKAKTTTALLRRKEQETGLGQMAAIEELENRLTALEAGRKAKAKDDPCL